jgi:hypothetical protein
MFFRQSADRGNDPRLRWFWKSHHLLFELMRQRADWSEDEGPWPDPLRDKHLKDPRYLCTYTEEWWEEMREKIEALKRDCEDAAAYIATRLQGVSAEPVLKLAAAIDLAFGADHGPPDTDPVEAAWRAAEMTYRTLKKVLSEQSARSEVTQKLEDSIRRRAETLLPKLAKLARKETPAADLVAGAGPDPVTSPQANTGEGQHSRKPDQTEPGAADLPDAGDEGTRSRNAFIYESRKAGKTWVKIKEEVNAVREWDQLDVGGVRKACGAHIRDTGAEPLPPGKPGRPRKSKPKSEPA